MSEWQPISTVPHDRFVLLLDSGNPRWAGNMEVGKWFGMPGDEDDGCFWSAGGPNGGLELERDFTHWMELPPDEVDADQTTENNGRKDD